MSLRLNQLVASREGNSVVRNHSTSVINQASYNVGNHSCAAAQLLYILFPDNLSLPLVQAVLFHDAASEFATGDVVGPAKTKWPNLGAALEEIEEELQEKFKLMPQLTDKEQLILSLVDKLELSLYCIEQSTLGCRSKKFLYMKGRVNDSVRQLCQQLNRIDIYKLVNAYAVELGDI